MVQVIEQKNVFQKTKSFFVQIGTIKTVSLAFVLIMVGGFAVTFYELGKPQEIRQHAASVDTASYISSLKQNIMQKYEQVSYGIPIQQAEFVHAINPQQYTTYVQNGVISPLVASNISAEPAGSVKLQTVQATTIQPNTTSSTSSPSATIITSCGLISKSGDYALNQDLNGDSSSICLDVENTSNVNIDCQNHKITRKLIQAAVGFINVNTFSLKNCYTSDPGDYYFDYNIFTLTSSNGTISNNTSDIGTIGLLSSNHIAVTNNKLQHGYIGLIDSTYNTLSQNQLDVSRDSSGDGPPWGIVLRSNSMNNTIDKNTITALPVAGYTNGFDDGIVLYSNSNNNIVSNNNISNFEDAGIETAGFIQNTQIINNNIKNSQMGISSYWGTSWLGNTVSGNTIDQPNLMLAFWRSDGLVLTHETGTQTHVYFQNNTFANNVVTNRITPPGAPPTVAFFDFQSLSSDITPDKITLANNLLQNNNFSSSQTLYLAPASMIVDGGGNICADSSNGAAIKCTNFKPTVTNVTINPKPITANATNQYVITVTATDPDGGNDINNEHAIINAQGPNASAYRGYLSWAAGTWFTPLKSGTSLVQCSGGGYGGISGTTTYGPQYINLISCSTTVSGNTHTSTFTVTFNPIFTSPTSNNTLTGLVYDTKLNADGWKAFDTFSLAANVAPPATPTPTLRPTPTICVTPAPICLQYKSPGVCNDNAWSYPPNPCVTYPTAPATTPTPITKLQSGAVCTTSSQCASGICNYINNTSGTCQ